MVPQPRRQNPQRQPLTVALRKICRDYPAGAGVLKELLQNADDAGASTVKFVLDTRCHPSSPVLADGLADYQGPALLAYNDARFSEKDFQSLTSLADSNKMRDKAATGKFGLGFSSVFNWTDCPSILSGSTLLFLDPHHSWSRVFDPPGGPDYDFPASVTDQAMINQLRCFSLLGTEWDHPFDGTIIRIPLRSASQASRSEISNLETLTNDIQDSMDVFADEIGSSGLLFLNSVQRIVLSINDEQLNEVEATNGHDLRGPKQHLKGILARSIKREDRIGGEIYHELHIRHRFQGQEVVKKFGILNLVAGSSHDSSVEDWAESEKLFPWVAVAAPLKKLDGSSDMGRLFSTLPLPIPTGLPVHIHGRFSISADRSRLHGLDDRGMQDHRPREWNKFLFEQMIPRAWAGLLWNLCLRYPTENHFHLWPTNTSDIHQLWYGLSRAVVDQVFQKHLPVWFTHFGYVALEDGLLAPEETQSKDKTAFREAKVPVIFAANYLFDEARQRTGSQILQPRTLYESLRRLENLDSVTRQSRLVLLEILLPEIPLTDLGLLEIFPFQDGNFRSLKLSPVFLHCDSFEKLLFARQSETNIDTDQLSNSASRLLHELVSKGNQVIRYRTPEDLRDYFLKHVISGLGDTILFDEDKLSVLEQIWIWILRYSKERLPLSTLGPLWLIPLRGSAVRKLVPLDTSNFVTWFPAGEVNDLSLEIARLNPGSTLQILADSALSDEILQFLRSSADQELSLHIRDGSKFENFLDFLIQGRNILQTAGEDVKHSVLRILRRLSWSRNRVIQDSVCEKFKSLCLFKAIEWPANAMDLRITQYWTDMTSDVVYVGLSRLVPVPPSPKHVFVDVSNETERALFEDIGLLKCMNDVQMLEEIVIPALRSGDYDQMNPSFRLDVANLLFRNYYHISPCAQSCLSDLQVVPLEKRKDDGSINFGCPVDVLDPQKFALTDLYFEDEIRLPERQFYNQFSAVLADCGMVQYLNERIVFDRVRIYSRREFEFGVVASRARKLLQMPLQRDTVQSVNLTQVVREYKWLPARAPDKSNSFTNSFECREKSDMSFVGYVWHVLPFNIEESWRSILGWHDRVDVNVLISQLVRSIDLRDIHSIDQILFYLCRNHLVEDYASRLLQLSFVRSSDGQLASAVNVCRRGVEKLTPYLRAVEPRFWDDHSEIMTLAKIPEFPGLEQLKALQKALQSKNALNEQDLDVAIELARIWGVQFHEVIDGLKLPDENGVFVEIGNLVFNDTPWLSAGTHAILHPKISRTIAEQLKIQPLSELTRNGDLGISDPDDDEFYQREEITDGIRDTLDRYTREHTFHEYLANADDCGSASEVNFLFDRTIYGTKHLLTQDLQDLQGPSLLIHNNGVFTDADFEGLKYVGRGSKREDPATIGKFGRGSQTMYHWTDVPMILSGGHLLILDPLRKHLPFNYRTRQKKPGVLIKYAKLKPTYRDQLAPFEGLWGFNSNQSFYNGTIFRFPLRADGQSSELLESGRCPDASTTIQIFHNAFDEARLALLFLRNIATIDFSVKGNINFKWKVRRGNWPQSGSFSDWANVIVEQQNHLGKNTNTTEQWWRAIKDVHDAPAELQHRHKRRMKNVECGIAALVPQSEKATSALKPLRSKFFNCLPLKFESTLPVQIHATFLLSGDRQNIATEETSQDAGSEWNKWLLQEALPHLYLQFIEDIGRKTGHKVYNYFPVELSGRQHLLSDLIRAPFWEHMCSSTCRLFPVIEVSNDFSISGINHRVNRTAPNLVTFGGAVFDLLDQRNSEALQPLLGSYMDTLVRPPMELAKYIRRMPQANVLTPTMVREALKSNKAVTLVEKAKERDKNFLDTLLSFIMPQIPTELIELHHCPVLPLADGTLGTLSLESMLTTSDKMYFSADAESHDLFSFASSILSDNKGNSKFLTKILDSGQFNLKRLEKKDVSVMLGYKDFWSLESTSETWLSQFWKYMNFTSPSNTGATKPEVLDLDSLRRFPLLLIRHRDGLKTLSSLHDFERNPVVVQSAVREHMDIFKAFPGLDVVDFRTLPRSFYEAEKSLCNLASLDRFLRSIGLLATRDAKSLTEFVKSNLNEKNIQTLQHIARGFRAVDFGPSLLDTVNDLPLWPRISSKSGYLTAKEAIVAQNVAFIVPWIKEYHRFARFSGPHQQAGINDVDMLQKYVLPALPEFLGEENRAPYTRLIKAIFLSSSFKQEIKKGKKTRTFVETLTVYRLAPRQDGKLCLASSLFDHNDAVFSAAFRMEATTRFLMLEVRLYSALWNELGIGRRESGRFRGPDYLACLLALQSRLTGDADQQLRTDIERVLYPLCTNDGALRGLDTTTWSTIARLPLFLVSPVSTHELEYRRRQMEILASENNNMCLNDIILREHVAVCWSQTPFALHEPSSFSIQRCGLVGQPTCAMVWQHLAFLAKSAPSITQAEVPSFIDDLRRTYHYLHLNAQESKRQFTQPDVALWLNIEMKAADLISLDTLNSSWISLEHLILDSPCDAPPLMTVQPFLAPFSTLLKELGCKSLHYPQVSSQFFGRSETAFTLLWEQWKQGVLIDVEFQAEGNSISAHKIILASRSSYCKTQFHGPWGTVSEASKVIELKDMAYTTLRILIEFCYNENHDWAQDMRLAPDDSLPRVADKLDAFLDVIVAADRWLMPDLHANAQREVMNGIRFFVRPDNVELVKKVADEANARELSTYCEEFCIYNAEAVLLANK